MTTEVLIKWCGWRPLVLVAWHCWWITPVVKPASSERSDRVKVAVLANGYWPQVHNTLLTSMCSCITPFLMGSENDEASHACKILWPELVAQHGWELRHRSNDKSNASHSSWAVCWLGPSGSTPTRFMSDTITMHHVTWDLQQTGSMKNTFSS